MLAPHQQRVVAEKDELGERLAKLNRFNVSAIFHSLSGAERRRLTRQAQAMKLYFDILEERIAAFGVFEE